MLVALGLIALLTIAALIFVSDPPDYSRQDADSGWDDGADGGF